MNKKRQPDKICSAGGREFLIYREYDDIAEKDILNYPDFEDDPQYTDEGYPFATAVQECCEYFLDDGAGEDEPSGDCGSCKWFKREETLYDMIGVCMCDKFKQTLMREEK